MKIKFILLLLFVLVFMAHTSSAETRIDIMHIDTDTIWSKADSPYIISNYVDILRGATLTVGPGVEILADNTAIDNIPEIYVEDGSLILHGNGLNRVSVRGLRGLHFKNATSTIEDADFIGTGLYFDNSNSFIATSTISNAEDAIYSKNSVIRVHNTYIKNNTRGITIPPLGDPFLVDNYYEGNIGGIGNAEGDIGSTTPFIITDSSIVNNVEYAFSNFSADMMEAFDNWWGGSTGPTLTGVNGISGAVDFDPWLTAEPILDSGKESLCCSSVLFIPGIEGTELFTRESLPLGMGNINNTLWPPNNNADVEKLFMDNAGNGLNSVYSGQPIKKFLGVYNIYNNFSTFMDNMVKDKSINEWKSFGYDWRKIFSDTAIVEQSKSTTTESLIRDIESLALHSQTGKVSIVAHSNGGLVAKYLVKKLDELGKVDLIDSVISVAVPSLGTPQAISGLLHGDGQSIAEGLILKQSVARQLGVNMPSVYGLLPSREFFSRILGPTIIFASTTVVGVNDGSYPSRLDTSEKQNSFLADTYNIRANTDIGDTSEPIKANTTLLALSDTVHDVVDTFFWPASVANIAILGWNISTTKGVNYYNKSCGLISLLISCIESDYENMKTNMGDGTVLSKSASFGNGEVISMDLKNISENEGKNIQHANILESSTTQALVKQALMKNANTVSTYCSTVSTVAGVKCGEPDYASAEPDRIVLGTHSPVELHVYDNRGRHTGVKSLVNTGVEDDILTFYDNEILGGNISLREEGDGNYDTRIELPYDNKNYSVIVKGTDIGSFDFDITKMRGDTVISSAKYLAIPSSPTLIASTTISGNMSPASEELSLIIDIDGNGTVDLDKKPDETISNENRFDLLRTLVNTLFAKSPNKLKSLLKNIDRVENLLNKNKNKQAVKFLNKMSKHIGHKNSKNLSDNDKEQILNAINALLDQIK